MQNTIPPSVVGGMALALMHLVPKLKPRLGPADDVLKLIGAGRTRSFDMRNRLLQETLPAVAGAPRSPACEAPVEKVPSWVPVQTACYEYVSSHPGAVEVHPQRRGYSPEFRRFVVELTGPGGLAEGLTGVELSRATGVPEGSLKGWLYPRWPQKGDTPQSAPPAQEESDRASGPAEESPSPPAQEMVDSASEPAEGPPTPSAEPSPSSEQRTEGDVSDTVRDVHLQAICSLYLGWQGTFQGFCEMVRNEHRLSYSNFFIGQFLQAVGLRVRKPRKAGSSPLSRESFAFYFPGAQWFGDGTSIAVHFWDQVFVFNVEAFLDGASNALVGLDISDAEDEEALRKAYEAGVETAGSPPLAVTLDGRPSNHTPGAAEAMEGTIVLRATPGRGEAKAPIEGTFGLFQQALSPLVLAGQTLREIARSYLEAVLWAWAMGRNGRPRRRLGQKSPAEAYQEASPTPEETARALKGFRELRRRQEKARRTREARRDQVRLRLLTEGLAELGIPDPDRRVAVRLAYYSREAIAYGLALYRTKRDQGTVPEGADPARYLGGIIRNDHEKRELLSLSEHLLEQRIRLRDISLEPLVRREERLRAELSPCARTQAFVQAGLAAAFDIDFRFWTRAAATALSDLPPVERSGIYRHLCRCIAADFKTDRERRAILVDRLAEAAVSLAC